MKEVHVTDIIVGVDFEGEGGVMCGWVPEIAVGRGAIQM